MGSKPRISIGLPVYNGERFLEEALDSILGQSYEDFELIISDNASTDRTEVICRSYEKKDSRVRYYRSDKNRGAAWNFNHVFDLSVGKYFKWAAHDDNCAPNFLERCIEVLDSDPGIVVCFAKTIQIDDQGRLEKKRDHISLPSVCSTKAHERFGNIIMNRHGCEAVFGLIRSDTLCQTPLIGNYIASDLVLLALLSIYGRFFELPDYLFYQREHPGRSVKGEDHEVTEWFDPARARQIVFPWWRVLWEYALIVARKPMVVRERILCFLQVARWIRTNGRRLKWDLKDGVERALLLRGSRRTYHSLSKWILSGKLPIPSWAATSIALVVIACVEGSNWVFRSSRWMKKADVNQREAPR